LGILISPLLLAGCNQTTSSISAASLTESITPGFLRARPYRYTAKDKECLERAMFFESNRSSREGMVAVGTVVMNRLKSGQHGDTICAVVGEPRQFAPGVLTRRMNSKAMPDVQEAAEAVLKGERASKLKNAMHFHTAGLKFPYKNMHYVEVAGGNAFYEKRGRNWKPLPDDSQFAIASAAPAADAPAIDAPASPAAAATPEVLVASATPVPIFKPASTAAAKPQPIPQGNAVIAMREPDAARFGSAQDFDTATSSSPIMAEAVQNEVQPTMAFQSTPDDTNAIGALIMSQSRPMQTY
jgi:spore germination cell wall hydrolase CwlJ-like protein